MGNVIISSLYLVSFNGYIQNLTQNNQTQMLSHFRRYVTGFIASMHKENKKNQVVGWFVVKSVGT